MCTNNFNLFFFLDDLCSVFFLLSLTWVPSQRTYQTHRHVCKPEAICCAGHTQPNTCKWRPSGLFKVKRLVRLVRGHILEIILLTYSYLGIYWLSLHTFGVFLEAGVLKHHSGVFLILLAHGVLSQILGSRLLPSRSVCVEGSSSERQVENECCLHCLKYPRWGCCISYLRVFIKISRIANWFRRCAQKT